MKTRNSHEILQNLQSNLCVGLDPDIKKIPKHLLAKYPHPDEAVLHFLMEIIDTTKNVAGAYKINSAFLEAMGWRGMKVNEEIFHYINQVAPQIFTITDVKRGDIGNTNTQYGIASFKVTGADAMTVAPYMGFQSLAETFFSEWLDKYFFALCCTTNLGANEFQDAVVHNKEMHNYKLYDMVAKSASKYMNCGLVTGATVADKVANVRALVGDIPWLLVPGVGAQGGDLRDAVRASMNTKGTGFLVNSSRDIIYASNGEDFAEMAYKRALQLNTAITSIVIEKLDLQNQSVH